MGRTKRTGLEGLSITALAVAANFAVEGEPLTAVVAAAIGVVSLIASDRVRLEEFSVSEETVENVSEQASGAIEDAADSAVESADGN